jgi:hypothetical protein
METNDSYILVWIKADPPFLFITELPPNDVIRLNARVTTATYNEPKIGILKRDDVSAPKFCKTCNGIRWYQGREYGIKGIK